jgi:hypothetical protein
VSLWLFLALILSATSAFAQFQMPDPRQMSGIPRPVTDLPDGHVSVRVIRGSFDNNVAGQDVEMKAGATTQTVKTDQDGRAEFSGVAAGTPVTFSATVDGEALTSQEFPFPGSGGVRLMLVASNPNAAPSAPAVTAPVVLGDRTRIVLEPDDEVVRVYYLLDIVNNGSAPANPPQDFGFDMPHGSGGAALLDGTAPQTQLQGSHLHVPGPFPPGSTMVQVATQIPVTTGAVDITQQFPAAMQQVAVIVRKIGDTAITSPQITNQQEVTEDAETYIQAVGPPVNAGTPITLSLAGIPHHSPAPRRTALAIAALIAIAGLWFAWRAPSVDVAEAAAERKRLLSKRDKLFAQLVRLERDHRAGRGDAGHFAARREELVAALERVYGALDDDTTRGLAA